MMNHLSLMIKDNLTNDLLKSGYGEGAHCYVASEAYYHLAGGKLGGCKSMSMKHEGVQHWFIIHDNEVIDLTKDQFKSSPNYNVARGRGFLTKKPSKRAQKLINRIDKSFFKHAQKQTIAWQIIRFITDSFDRQDDRGLYNQFIDNRVMPLYWESISDEIEISKGLNL